MKAHIRKCPTKGTYLDSLSHIFDAMTKMDMTESQFDSLTKVRDKLGSDEYFEKFKEDMGYGRTKDIEGKCD